MKPTDQHIDDLFRKGMEGYSEVPPAPVWEAIEQRLDNNKRRRFLFWPLLLLVVAGGIVISAKYIRHNLQLKKLPPETEKGFSIHSVASEMDQKSKLPLNKKANKNTAANTDSSYEEQLATTKSAKAKVSMHADNQLGHGVQTVSKENRKPASSDIRLTNAAPTTAHNYSVSDRNNQVNSAKVAAHHPVTKAHLEVTLPQHSGLDTRTSEPGKSIGHMGGTTESKSQSHTAKEHEATAMQPQPVSAKSRSGSGAVSTVTKNHSDTHVDIDARSRTSAELTPEHQNRADSDQTMHDLDEEEIPAVPGELVSSVKPVQSDATKFEEKQTGMDSIREKGLVPGNLESNDEVSVRKKKKQKNSMTTTKGLEPAPSSINQKGSESNQEASFAAQSKRKTSPSISAKGSHSNTGKDVNVQGVQNEKDTSRLAGGIAGNPDGMQATGKAPREQENSAIKKSFHFVFRLGLMAGRESGFASFTANKTVLDVFFEWTIFRNFGLSISPAYKWAKTNQDYTISDGNYVQAGNTEVRMFNPEKDSMGGLSGYASYAFAQTFDSMTATKTLGRSYREVELPLSLFYRITKNWTISAGCNMVWGAAPKFSGSVDKINGLRLEDTVRNYFDLNFKGPDPAAKFSHAGVDTFGAYKDPGNDPTNKPFRLGYVFSVRYAHRYGINAELSMRQQAGGLSAITDAQLKSLLSQPFFRLSIGYEIGRSKK